MGVCCGKDSMPVVDDDAPTTNSPASVPNSTPKPSRARSKSGAAQKGSPQAPSTYDSGPLSPTAAVPFDYVFDPSRTNRAIGNDSVCFDPRQRSLGATFGGERAYTPRDLDATTVASAGTMGTTGTALSFVTNGTQDVSYEFIDRFVDRVLNGNADFLDSTFNGTIGGGQGRKPNIAAVVAKVLAKEETVERKLLRLMDLEESMRGEIMSAERMDMMVCAMGLQRMVPTVRRRKSMIGGAPSRGVSPQATAPMKVSGLKKKKKKSPSGADRESRPAPVLVIHANDIQVELDEDDGAVALDGTVASLLLDETLGGTTRRSANRRLDISVPNGPTEVRDEEPIYSPETSQPPNTVNYTTAFNAKISALEAQEYPSKVVPPANTTTATTVVEHLEMLALTAREVSIVGDVKGLVVTESWDFLSLPRTTNLLNSGAAFYRFLSKPAHQLDQTSLEMLSMFVNVTSFANESVDNNVPIVNCQDPTDLAKYVTILAKAMYVLPGVRLASVTKELLASLEYQKNCQAGETKFDESATAPYTFRQTKVIIKFLFSLVIQMKVSEVTDPLILESFKDFDGIVPAKVILLERTRRNIQKVDSTAKCKSVLLYYPINDGVLVSHATVVLNTAMPGVVSRILHTFGGQGAKENADAVKKTRQFMVRKFGDSRQGLSY